MPTKQQARFEPPTSLRNEKNILAATNMNKDYLNVNFT